MAAVALAILWTKQIRICINETIKKHSTNTTKHSKQKYTNYKNIHIYTHLHITKQVKTTTIKVKRNTVQDIHK